MLLITHNVIYIHHKFMNMQALLHTSNRSKLSQTHFVAHRLNLLAVKPIKAYMVPSYGSLEIVLVNFATTMLCFSKPWGPITPLGPVLSALPLYSQWIGYHRATKGVKDTEWDWQPEHDEAIESVKAVLINKQALAFYDLNEPVTVRADTSQSDLGACLMKKGNPVASRAMRSAKQNYAQTEKDMLASCFATSKFHQYVYGKPRVSLQTDHKPLDSVETTMQNTTNPITANIKSRHRELMLPHDIPDGRRQKIAMDIMTYHGQD